MKSAWSLLRILAFAWVASAPASAGVIFEQPLDASAIGVFSNTLGQVGADEIKLSDDAQVTRVVWYGVYASGDLDPTVLTVTYQLEMYRDDKGRPAMDADASMILPAHVRDTGLRLSGGGALDGRIIYEHQFEVASPLVVFRGKTHWLSLASADPDRNLLWLGSPSRPSDIRAVRGAGACEWSIQSQAGNLAFTLYGN